jgi:hypothetical protein
LKFSSTRRNFIGPRCGEWIPPICCGSCKYCRGSWSVPARSLRARISLSCEGTASDCTEHVCMYICRVQSCVDILPECSDLKAGGDGCAKFAFMIIKRACHDSAVAGRCDSARAPEEVSFMRVQCAATCGFCQTPVAPPAATCVDADPSCATWKAAGMDDTRVLAVLGVEHGRRAVLLVQANAMVPRKLTWQSTAVRAAAPVVQPLLRLQSCLPLL